MNLVLLQNKEIENNKVILSDYRHVHIRDVLKPEIGQQLKVGVLNGNIGTGEVIKHSKKETVLKVKINAKPPKPANICLVCCLPRPKTLSKVVYKATCLGIKDIHFINAEKVEKAYWDSNQHRYDQTIIDALSQSVDTILPKISFHKLFRPFVEDILPLLIKDKAVFAHPGGGKLTKSKHLVLIIGPEGGFNDFEVTLLSKYAKKLSLGERILRVEDALPTAVGMFIAN